MGNLFKKKTLLHQEASLASFLPPGITFASANVTGSNFSKLITGLAGEIVRTYNSINSLSNDYDILVKDELLTQWESAVGIPDNCFPATGSRATRRLHVLIKFAKMNVQTVSQMEALAVALGFTDAIVHPYAEYGLPPYDVPFTPVAIYGNPNSRYIIIISATGAVINIPPYDVPFTPSANSSTLLSSVFDIVKPANCTVIYVNN